MPKFFGAIGFCETVETAPGVWEEKFVEKKYYGDVRRSIRKLEMGEGVNDNININNEISIIADPYADHHFYAIRYVEWKGTKWKVSTVEVMRPRLILSLGGIYNENQA